MYLSTTEKTLHPWLGHVYDTLKINKRLFIVQTIERGELRQLKVKHQTKVTNRLAFAICSFDGGVDYTTDGYTRWRVGLTNRRDATARAGV